MCGITCVVTQNLAKRQQKGKSNHNQNVAARIEKSLESMKHRGPDSSGQWISEDGRVALGHARLEINDLSPSGYQPLHSSDGKIHAVVNGEIYDYPRLRAEMEDKINYRFQGTSDCEVVLALYQCYGLDFLEHCRGEFSICLYDSEKDVFFAVRDRYGIKPLFWTIQQEELWIAAEMKAFLALGWQPEWNVKAIVNGDVQIGNQTFFKNVQKVKPGHYLVCRADHPMEEHEYWNSTYPGKNIPEPRSEEEMITGFHDKLVEAIRLRLRADVKVGVSLSGGIDSSVVAGVTAHLLKEGHSLGSQPPSEFLSCFGIAFDADSGYDESETANRTADFLGVKFYKKHMNEQTLAEMFEDATWHIEQPNTDLNFIGVFALSSLFHEKGFKVNINGQGSDEINGGYNIFLPDFLREPDHAFSPPNTTLPSDDQRLQHMHSFESTLYTVYNSRLTLTSHQQPTPSRHQLNNLITPQQISLAHPPVPIHPSFTPPDTIMPPSLIEQTYLAHLSPRTLHSITQTWHPLHSAEYIFTKTNLQNLLLSHLGDRGEMAHSIEGRTPFLDHHLTEYANGVPPSMKIRWVPNQNEPDTKKEDGKEVVAKEKKKKGGGITGGSYIEKYILREAGKPYITNEVYERKKHPYTAPVTFQKGGYLYEVMSRLVTRENVEGLGWVDARGVEELVEKAFGGQDDGLGFRTVSWLAQLVVLMERFGVRKAVAGEEEGMRVNGEK